MSVRYWRATRKLNAEDLGLDPDNVTERLISLGHKKLLPREALERFALVESRAHSLVESSTFPFLNGLGHFLPNTKLEEVTRKLKELEIEFEQARQAFLDQYADLRQQASAEWYEAARRLVSDPERLVATIEASFPNLAPDAAGLRVRGAPVSTAGAGEPGHGPGQPGRAGSRSSRHGRKRPRKRRPKSIAEPRASWRIAWPRCAQQTAQLCEEMLESMRTGKTGVHQKTLNRLVRFIDEFKQLNFVGDQEMEAQLERVRQEFLLRSAEDYRDDTAAKARLQQGLAALAQTARDLAQQDSRELVERFGQLGHRRLHLAA